SPPSLVQTRLPYFPPRLSFPTIRPHPAFPVFPYTTLFRSQVLCYAPVAPLFRFGMGAAVTPTGEYWQQAPDGSIVLGGCRAAVRSEEHTSELQSHLNLVCRLLLEKKK